MRLDRGETASQPWPRIARGFCLTTDYRGMGIHLPALPPGSLSFSSPSHRLSLATAFSSASPFSHFTTVSDSVNCPVAIDIPFPLNLRVKGRTRDHPKLVLARRVSTRNRYGELRHTCCDASKLIETNHTYFIKHRLLWSRNAFYMKTQGFQT